jgi:alginate O-acetyltransferase complex protein AlgI
MLFNSPLFIFLFLPVSVFVYSRLALLDDRRPGFAWLVLVSLTFYSWWNPEYLLLIIGSVCFNYSLGAALAKHPQKRTLVFGVTANLLLLGYYKYAHFFVANLNAVLGTGYNFSEIILPLAISFFTFQQIMYLVDAYRGKTHEYRFLQYLLFITFFPQLIAGPIVHHKEVMPQFAKNRPSGDFFSIGLTLFCLGLFKKVILADSVAPFADMMFEGLPGGLTFVQAWTGALAYTFQLYFDFSGYSDMAIGLGYLFGIRLPLNFFSPYKAASIIDFWRRWHITLSRFLKDYLYIPLGGNRRGPWRRYGNLLLTMLLGGLWHGAGWTFVIWGGLHGAYLIINHAWRWVRPSSAGTLEYWAGRALTFLAVVIAWVFFRAANVEAAISMLQSMAGMRGIVLPQQLISLLGPLTGVIESVGMTFGDASNFGGYPAVGWLSALFVIAWFFPNSAQFMRHYAPALTDGFSADRFTLPLAWRPNLLGFIIIGIIAVWAVASSGEGTSKFLYYQF